MSLKSSPLVIEGTFTEVQNGRPEDKTDCWCTGRNNKIHKTGDPFCLTPLTYKTVNTPVSRTGIIQAPPLTNLPAVTHMTPMTFDEDLIMACLNRAIMKTPSEFVPLLEEGRVNLKMARLIMNELKVMGYGITEDAF